MLLVLYLKLYVVRPVPLLSWSGSLISMIARSVAKSMSCNLNLIAVSPLIDEEGKLVLSGVVNKKRAKHRILDVGTHLRIKIAYELKNMTSMGLGIEFVESIRRHMHTHGLEVSSIDFKFIDREHLEVLSDIAKAQRYLVKVRFYPTIFVFRGWRVLYPSPSRLVYSLARAATQLLELDQNVMRKKARRLTRYLELLSSNTKIISLDIGADRIVKAFWGDVLYGVYGYDNARLLKQLLSIGELVNVGKSRGIGFGHIRLLDMKAIE